MLQASIFFFLLALLSLAAGVTHAGQVSFEAGRLLLYFFLTLAVLSFVLSLITRRKEPRHST